MRAVGFDVIGGPEVLRPVELPVPEPGPGQVLVRVAYAGVNYGEVQHRLGDFGAPDGTAVPGLEVSGEVAALGPRRHRPRGRRPGGRLPPRRRRLRRVRPGARRVRLPARRHLAARRRRRGPRADHRVRRPGRRGPAGRRRHRPDPRGRRRRRLGRRPDRPRAGRRRRLRHGRLARQGRVREAVRLRRRPPARRLRRPPARGRRRPRPVGGPTRLASLPLLAPFGRLAALRRGGPPPRPDACRSCRCGRTTARWPATTSATSPAAPPPRSARTPWPPCPCWPPARSGSTSPPNSRSPGPAGPTRRWARAAARARCCCKVWRLTSRGPPRGAARGTASGPPGQLRGDPGGPARGRVHHQHPVDGVEPLGQPGEPGAAGQPTPRRGRCRDTWSISRSATCHTSTAAREAPLCLLTFWSSSETVK